MKILSEKQLKYNENVNLDRTPKKCYNFYSNIKDFQGKSLSWPDMTDSRNKKN